MVTPGWVKFISKYHSSITDFMRTYKKYIGMRRRSGAIHSET